MALVVGTVVVLIVAGNGVILGASLLASQTTGSPPSPDLSGIDNLEVVDPKLWRGAAPSPEGYAALARAGVGTVIDLRAEEGVEADVAVVEGLGMRAVRMPVRDGQVPSTEEVEAFLRIVSQSDSPVFVHCGAGVGRTSTMVGAWLVTTGDANPMGAMRRNLAVGPPSLEQLAFVAGLRGGEISRPSPLVTAFSRVLDAPRRTWHLIGL